MIVSVLPSGRGRPRSRLSTVPPFSHVVRSDPRNFCSAWRTRSAGRLFRYGRRTPVVSPCIVSSFRTSRTQCQSYYLFSHPLHSFRPNTFVFCRAPWPPDRPVRRRFITNQQRKTSKRQTVFASVGMASHTLVSRRISFSTFSIRFPRRISAWKLAHWP